ncbi:MAG: hypothetical protein WCW67_05075 [Candidatus Margulisiibacteriota bacterium]|jgi:hypothetical protein
MVDISGLNTGQKIISFLSKVDTSRDGRLDATEIDKAVEQGLISIDDAKALKEKMGPDGLLDAKELMKVVEEKKKDPTVFSESQENEAAAIYEPGHNVYETVLRGGVTVYLFGSDTKASVLAKPVTTTINGRQTTLPPGTEVRIENGKIASFVTPNQANGARVEVQLAGGRVAVPAGTEVTIVNGKVKSLNIPSDARMMAVGSQTVAWAGVKAPRSGEYASTTSALAIYFVTNTDLPIILDNGIEGPGRSVVRLSAVADPDGKIAVNAEVRQADGSWKKTDNLDLRQILKSHYGRETQPNILTVSLSRLSQIPNLPHPTSSQPMVIDLKPLAASVASGLPANRRTTTEAKGIAEHVIDLRSVTNSSDKYQLKIEVEKKVADLEKAVAEYDNAPADQRAAKLAALNTASGALYLVFHDKVDLNASQQGIVDGANQRIRIAQETRQDIETRKEAWEEERTTGLKNEFPRIVDHHTNNIAELATLVQNPAANTRFARFDHPAVKGMVSDDINTRRLIGQRAVYLLTSAHPEATPAELAAVKGPLQPFIQEYLPANQRLLTFTHQGKNYAAVAQYQNGDWHLASGSLPQGTFLRNEAGGLPQVCLTETYEVDRSRSAHVRGESFDTGPITSTRTRTIPITSLEHVAARGRTPVAAFVEPTIPERPAPPVSRGHVSGEVLPGSLQIPEDSQPGLNPPTDQTPPRTPRPAPRSPQTPVPPTQPRQPAFDPNLPISNYVVPNDAVVDKSGGNVRRISIPAGSRSTMTFTVQEDSGPKTYTLHPNETLYFDGAGHPTHRVFYGDGVQQTGRFATNESRTYFGVPATATAAAPVQTPAQPQTTRTATLREPTLDEIGLVFIPSQEEKIPADDFGPTEASTRVRPGPVRTTLIRPPIAKEQPTSDQPVRVAGSLPPDLAFKSQEADSSRGYIESQTSPTNGTYTVNTAGRLLIYPQDPNKVAVYNLQPGDKIMVQGNKVASLTRGDATYTFAGNNAFVDTSTPGLLKQDRSQASFSSRPLANALSTEGGTIPQGSTYVARKTGEGLELSVNPPRGQHPALVTFQHTIPAAITLSNGKTINAGETILVAPGGRVLAAYNPTSNSVEAITGKAYVPESQREEYTLVGRSPDKPIQLSAGTPNVHALKAGSFFKIGPNGSLQYVASINRQNVVIPVQRKPEQPTAQTVTFTNGTDRAGLLVGNKLYIVSANSYSEYNLTDGTAVPNTAVRKPTPTRVAPAQPAPRQTTPPTVLAGNVTLPANDAYYGRPITITFDVSGRLTNITGEGVTRGGSTLGKATIFSVNKPGTGSRNFYLSEPLTAADGQPTLAGKRVIVDQQRRIIATIEQNGTVNFVPSQNQIQLAQNSPIISNQAPLPAAIAATPLSPQAPVDRRARAKDEAHVTASVQPAIANALRLEFNDSRVTYSGRLIVTVSFTNGDVSKPVYDLDVSQVKSYTIDGFGRKEHLENRPQRLITAVRRQLGGIRFIPENISQDNRTKSFAVPVPLISQQ